VDQVVLDMHTRNGLWAEIRSAGAHLAAEDDVIDDLIRWIGFYAGDGVTIHPAGSGISRFDIPWLFSRADPDLGWPLHYRELDISGMRMVFERAGWAVRRTGGPEHRAGRDVRDEIDEYLFMSGLIDSIRDVAAAAGTWPKMVTR
jgi:oligoribonuclease (3'-5' exoribonuclease)